MFQTRTDLHDVLRKANVEVTSGIVYDQRYFPLVPLNLLPKEVRREMRRRGAPAAQVVAFEDYEPELIMFPRTMKLSEATKFLGKRWNLDIWDLAVHGASLLKEGTVNQIVAFGSKARINGVNTYPSLRFSPNCHGGMRVIMGTVRGDFSVVNDKTAALVAKVGVRQH